MDVVRQRLERRHVDDLRRIGERRLETLSHQVVDRGQKGRERLARSRRRGDEGMAAGLDRGPRFGLRGRWRGETLGEPVRDRRMEQRFEGGRRSSRGRRFRAPVARPARSEVGVQAARFPAGAVNCACHIWRLRVTRSNAASEAPMAPRRSSFGGPRRSLAECGDLRQTVGRPPPNRESHE